MAQPPKQSGGDGDANFVRQIVTDPKNVPDVMLLTGYPGASSEEGCERLYLSPDLSSYVEIPRAAILHRAPVPPDQDPNGAVTLWVKKDAALHYKMAPAAQALANYFAGAIAAAQGAAGAGAQAGIIHQPTHHITPCRPTLFQPQCPYPSEICSVRCHTLAPPLCPVPFDAAAAGAAPQAAFAGQANVAWTHVTPCFPTAHRTCAIDCTAGCPYPTEVTCIPACRHTAACTPNVSFACFQGQQGPVAEAAFAGQANVVRSFVDCTFVCPTRIRPCLSYAPCITQNPVQCSIACTQPPQCIPETVNPQCVTRNLVQCTYICTQPPQCILETVDPQCVTRNLVQCTYICTQPPQCILETRNPVQCTFVCTQPPQCILETVNPQCVTKHPVQCSIVCPTRFVTCNPACQITNNPDLCPIASGPACPVVSAACPQQSLGCGGGFPGQQGGGPVAQAQAFNVGGSFAPGCWYSWNACPTLYGCQPHGTFNTPCCPW